MEYWEEGGGVGGTVGTVPAGKSAIVQKWFSSARVVKSLNQLGYFKFEKSRLPHGTPGRIAMAAAGNDRSAVDAVLQLIDRLGFDPLDAGSLEAALAVQPGRPAFGAR